MALSDITRRQPILDAIDEFRRLGRDDFLKEYKFGPAVTYWLVHEGRRYDAKAICGVAHGYARPDLGPLRTKDSSFNSRTAKRKLEQLQFRVPVGVSDHLIPPESADDSPFDPTSVEDAREQTLRTIFQRRGQKQFRDALLSAYGGRCMVTRCSVAHVLEAAHIHPYRGPDTNRVVNGLLLRADIHTLFDAGLIAIDPDSMTVVVAAELRSSEYGTFQGEGVLLPEIPDQQPNAEALRDHRQNFGL